MIVVVADTSPLNYVIQINCEHVLPALYERIYVPTTVVEEARSPEDSRCGARLARADAIIAEGAG